MLDSLDAEFLPHLVNEVVKILPPCLFPEFEERLARLAGRNPSGKPRLILEFGGLATRFMGSYTVAKYGAYVDEKIAGWHFTDPTTKESRTVDIPNFEAIPDEIKLRPDGTVKVARPIMVSYDYPIPNWYICDWMSPQKWGKDWDDRIGPYPRQGYYMPILRIFNPEFDKPPLFGYRPPAETDYALAELYENEKLDLLNFDTHFDDPVEGQCAQLVGSAMIRAMQRLKEERRNKAVQENFDILTDYFNTVSRVSTSG